VAPAVYALGTGVLPAPPLTPADRDALMAATRRFADRITRTRIPIEFDLVEGPAAAEILAKAEAMPADLLVIGTHGRSGFERLVLGSVAEKVLRKASCPVLTRAESRSGCHSCSAGALQAHRLRGRLLRLLDAHALNHAMSLAQEVNAHLTAMHVIELPPDVPREVHENLPGGPRSLREYVALAEIDRRARLNGAIPDTVRTYCAVDTILTTGKPYREILRVAHEQKADLLVVGIHGRGPIDRLLFGSTAQYLVRQATCPVLTLRKD
jgi:nucleotide-binding universal stress UspA family protein